MTSFLDHRTQCPLHAGIALGAGLLLVGCGGAMPGAPAPSMGPQEAAEPPAATQPVGAALAAPTEEEAAPPEAKAADSPGPSMGPQEPAVPLTVGPVAAPSPSSPPPTTKPK